MEVAGTRVIAEPGPRLHDLINGGLGQRLDGRKAVEKAQVEGFDRRNRGLLQHDLGQPDPIRIGDFSGPARATAAPRRWRSYQARRSSALGLVARWSEGSMRVG